jgi:hypothetical protein
MLKNNKNLILRILFKFKSEYIGNPNYLTGNALRHALGIKQNTSIGIFTDYPKVWQPQSYEEFFKIRTTKSFLRPYFHFFWDKINQKRARKVFYIPNFVTFDLLNPSKNII